MSKNWSSSDSKMQALLVSLIPLLFSALLVSPLSALHNAYALTTTRAAGSVSMPVTTNIQTAQQTSATSYTVVEGQSLTFQVQCANPEPTITVQCSMISAPSGATFSSTIGNPAVGTFVWSYPGPAGNYTAEFIASCVSSSSDAQCIDSQPITFTITVTAPFAPSGTLLAEGKSGTHKTQFNSYDICSTIPRPKDNHPVVVYNPQTHEVVMCFLETNSDSSNAVGEEG